MATDKQLETCVGWLDNFEKKYLAEMIRASRLVSEETWAMYRSMNIEGLREQRILENAEKEVKSIWKVRPDILKKGIKKEEEPIKIVSKKKKKKPKV